LCDRDFRSGIFINFFLLKGIFLDIQLVGRLQEKWKTVFHNNGNLFAENPVLSLIIKTVE